MLGHREVNEREARNCTPQGEQVDDRSLHRRKAREEAIAAPMRAAVSTRKVRATANIDPMSSEASVARRSPMQDIEADARGAGASKGAPDPRPLIRDARSDIARWTGKRALQNTNVNT